MLPLISLSLVALLIASAGASDPSQQQCGLSVPKCLTNKIIEQYKPTDPESASASACCAACQAKGARCVAFQMVPGRKFQ